MTSPCHHRGAAAALPRCAGGRPTRGGWARGRSARGRSARCRSAQGRSAQSSTTTGARGANAHPAAPSPSGRLRPSRPGRPSSTIVVQRLCAPSTTETLPATVPSRHRVQTSRRRRSGSTRRSPYRSVTATSRRSRPAASRTGGTPTGWARTEGTGRSSTSTAQPHPRRASRAWSTGDAVTASVPATGRRLSRPASSSIIGRRRIHHWSRGLRWAQSASSSARRIGRMRTPALVQADHGAPRPRACRSACSATRRSARPTGWRGSGRTGTGCRPAGSGRARPARASNSPWPSCSKSRHRKSLVYIGLAFSLHHGQEEPLAGRGSCRPSVSTSSRQLLEGDALLVQVHPDRAAGEPAQQGQVAAVAAHGLDHEAAPGRGAGLPDPVDGVDDQVERAVRADRQLGVGHVVVDGGRQADHRDLERRVPVPLGATWCAPPRRRPSRR